MKHIDPQRHRRLFAFGVALMVINVPLGWTAVAVCAVIAAADDDWHWLALGVALYLASWLLLGLGFLIAGRTGLEYARRIRRRRHRLRALLEARRQRRQQRLVDAGGPDGPDRPRD